MSEEHIGQQMPHMQPQTSDRGFNRMPDITGPYGHTISAYESSAASGPHLWISIGDTTAHLTAEQAWQFSQQIQWLVTNHYHGDSRPGQI